MNLNIGISLAPSARLNVWNPIYVFINLKTDHTLDLDNLLLTANSLINLFWHPILSSPPPTDKHIQGLVAKHSLKKDIGAFCYTFSILLLVASRGAIRERKEEVRGVTSLMLRIMEEDTELVANAIETTYKQFRYARMQLNLVKSYWYEEVVDEDLVSKLKELCT